MDNKERGICNNTKHREFISIAIMVDKTLNHKIQCFLQLNTYQSATYDREDERKPWRKLKCSNFHNNSATKYHFTKWVIILLCTVVWAADLFGLVGLMIQHREWVTKAREQTTAQFTLRWTSLSRWQQFKKGTSEGYTKLDKVNVQIWSTQEIQRRRHEINLEWGREERTGVKKNQPVWWIISMHFDWGSIDWRDKIKNQYVHKSSDTYHGAAQRGVSKLVDGWDNSAPSRQYRCSYRSECCELAPLRRVHNLILPRN